VLEGTVEGVAAAACAYVVLRRCFEFFLGKTVMKGVSEEDSVVGKLMDDGSICWDGAEDGVGGRGCWWFMEKLLVEVIGGSIVWSWERRAVNWV